MARPLHVTARLDRDLILALTQVRLAPTVSGAFWARHAPGTAGVYVLVYATVRNTGDADRYVYADRTLCVIDATGHALPYDPDATSEAGWHYQSANYSLIKAGNASDEILAFDGTRPAHTVQIGYRASGGQVHRLAAVSL